MRKVFSPLFTHSPLLSNSYMHDKQQIDTFTPASYFKHLDSNRDNFLSIAELMSGGLSEMKLEEQNEIIEYIQQEVDLDKDGYISMEEFLKSEENGDGLIDWNEEDRQWANEHLQPEYAQQAAAAAANTQQQQYMKNQRFDSEYYDHHVQQQNSNNNKKPFVGGVPDKFKAL